MTQCDDGGLIAHRVANIFDSDLTSDSLQKMHWNSSMHPRQGCHGKLEFARNDFAAIFQSIDDHVHALRSIGGEGDLFRFSIDIIRDLLANALAIGEPAIPMHVAVTHHLFVVACRCCLWSNRQRSGCGTIQISHAFSYGKFLSNFVPINHHREDTPAAGWFGNANLRPGEIAQFFHPNRQREKLWRWKLARC